MGCCTERGARAPGHPVRPFLPRTARSVVDSFANRLHVTCMMRRACFSAYQSLVCCVRSTRDELGLSQERLALRAGLHRNTVRLFETGQIDPAFSSVSRLLFALCVTRAVLGADRIQLWRDRDHVPRDSHLFRYPAQGEWTVFVRPIGKAIRCRRQVLGLTQEELADAAGVSNNTIGRIERWEVDPSVSTILSVYRALRVETVTVQGDRPVLLARSRSSV